MTPLHVVELAALAGLVGRLHQAELLHLVRIGGRCWSIYCTRPNCWPAVALLPVVALRAVELVGLARISGRC